MSILSTHREPILDLWQECRISASPNWQNRQKGHAARQFLPSSLFGELLLFALIDFAHEP